MDTEGKLLLKTWRAYRSRSQAELAKLSGVSRNAINRIENGTRDARPDTVRKLATALGIEPHQLRGITAEPAEPGSE